MLIDLLPIESFTSIDQENSDIVNGVLNQCNTVCWCASPVLSLSMFNMIMAIIESYELTSVATTFVR